MVEVIWIGLISMETKLHTLLAEWKVLMLQTKLRSVKRWVPHTCISYIWTGPTICVSSANEIKSQVRWVVALRWKS
jgi:hypothetical protein